MELECSQIAYTKAKLEVYSGFSANKSEKLIKEF